MPAFHSPKAKSSRRSSLLDDKLDPRHLTAQQREDLVRPPALIALETLLEAGDREAPVVLEDDEEKVFAAFKGEQESLGGC